MADVPSVPGELESFVKAGVDALVEQLYDPDKLTRLQGAISNAVAKGSTVANGAIVEGALGLAAEGAELLERADKVVQAIVAPAMALLAGHLLGVSVSAAELREAATVGEGSPIANAVVQRVLGVLQGPPGGLEPSDAGATKFLGMLGSLTFQSWFEGILLEHVLSEIPGQEAMESTSKLAKDLISSLGLSRLARTALRPLVRTTISTPLEWKVNATYRPTLLGASTAVRQFVRGRWDWDDTVQELARAGYSDERINALLNEQRKFFSAAEVRQFVTREHWTNDVGLQHLRDQGYDELGALEVLRLEGIKRIEQLESAQTAAITSAYVSRDIERGEFLAQLAAHIGPQSERELAAELGETRRALNLKHLSSGDAAAAVKAKILAYPDYRQALAREGYTDEAITVKDLLLRWEIDKQVSIEQHRAQLAAERAAEKQAAAERAAARLAEVQADRARKRRGAPGALERAVVRGLIPIARYEEVIADEADPDTVRILVALVESDRAAYVAQQGKADEAAKRAARQGLDIGQLQAAVLAGVLTLAEFGTELARLGFAPADAGVLVATLAARKADHDQALADRAEAEARARVRSIDLGRLEQLVRRGLRTMSEYAAQLEALGYDEGSRAGMVELLEAKIGDDATAAQTRAELDAKKAGGELTIAEFRRAVVLEVKSPEEFDAFLLAEHVSADKRALLMAELADDVAQAELARRNRERSDTELDARGSSLPLVRRAARLGIVTVGTYQERLARAGWSADDIALETDLLLAEIADVQAARARRSSVETELGAGGLSLSTLARAVKAGVVSLEEYQARAIALGVSAADVPILVRVLADELATTQAARVRRTEIASELDARKVSLAVLEDAVRAGSLTLEAYTEQLEGLGLTVADAELLSSLLLEELAPSGA